MYKIKDLIEFLRLDRRYEEADEKNQEIDQSKVSITVLDTNEIRVIDRKEFENFKLYNRIFNLLDTFNPTHFYVLSLGEKRIFYIKIPTTNDGYNYLNLETKKAEIVENEELLNPIELDFQTNHYFYDKEKREVVISAENLKEVTIFDDKIFFNPKKLDLETDTYTYTYSKPISTFCQFINGIIDFVKIVISPLVLSIDKKKDVKITVKQKGTIFLIPSIYVVGDNYYLWYYYTSSSKKPFYEVNEEDAALKLEFKGKEPFLSFLNETIFTQENFNYLDAYGKKRRIDFIEEFKQKIIEPLEKDINNNGYQSFYNAMITLYYLTDTIVLTLSNETLWKLFEEGISRNSLTNKLSLEEENIFVKLLEAIANKETTQEAFLSRLLRKKDEKTTYLEFLYNRIHGENGTTFANLVNKVWKQSRFITPDTKQNKEFINTDGPLLLPYESEKHLGFYFSNASVSFNEENQIAVSFETGQFKEAISTQSRVAVPYMKEIIAHYNYHPFYPIFLKNIEKQETELKLDAVVPAFVLMANANQQFWHNIIKTGEYALDALSIYTGYGALVEFRYLKTLTQLAVEAKEVSTATKIARAANILANVKTASGVVQITSGVVNTMIKITELDETEFGQKISKVLFFLELITLAGELTIPMKNGLKNAAKEAIENSDGVLRAKYPELFDELYKIVNINIESILKNKEFLKHFNDLKYGRIARVYPKLLSLEQEAVLRFYTTNAGYKNFNRALRGEIKMTDEYLAQEQLMNQALDKLPNYKTDALLYRIEYLTDEQIKNYYKIGEEVTNKHFTSSTYDVNAIGKAMERRSYTVLIRIESKNGKLIENISTFQKEKEILFKSNTGFYVDDIKMTSNPSDWASQIKTIILKEK